MLCNKEGLIGLELRRLTLAESLLGPEMPDPSTSQQAASGSKHTGNPLYFGVI